MFKTQKDKIMTYVKNIENELIQRIPHATDLLNDISQSIAERAVYNTSWGFGQQITILAGLALTS